MKRSKKLLLFLVILPLALIAVIIIFISPISKYLIEKYGSEYTGRRVKLSWAYVNPFTGYVHLSNLKIYEYKSDSLFLSASGLSVNFAILKFFKHTFEIKKLTLDHPVVKVIRDHKALNFDDVIKRLSPEDSVQKKPSITRVNLLDLKITDAEFHYTDKQIP